MSGKQNKGAEGKLAAPVRMSERYQKKIHRLKADKVKINQEKIQRLGYIDVDDHGFIDFPDFQFEPVTHADGRVYGMTLIGENFRKLLNEMPVYINPNSALAGCWPGNISRWMQLGFAPEREPHHLYPVRDEYDIVQHGCGGMNHLCPDLRIGLELGWKGLLEKVRYFRKYWSPADTSFYDGEELLLLGVLEWIKRHVDYALQCAAGAENAELKKHYIQIAQINRNLLEHPPANFAEACQFTAHFQSIDRIFHVGGALGQMDELLRPYYEKDVQEEKLEEDQAVWMIASVFFNDTHYSQIGGLTPAGDRDMTSRISFLILEAVHQLNIPSNVAIRLHDGIHPELLRRSLEYQMQDGTGVCYSCNVGCEEGFAKNGYPMELARMRVKSGCNWTAVPGEEYPLQDVTRLSMPTALVKALDELKEAEVPSVELLWELFQKHVRVMADCIREGYDWHYQYVSMDSPEIVLNLFMHGPIERGLNCAQGGVNITNYNIDGIGLATVADSLAAIEMRIEQEETMTYDTLFRALETNYEGRERERLMLKNIPRFGAPESPAEKWAVRIRDFFTTYCKENPTPKYSLPIIPGMFSHGDIVAYGKRLPATPNGRRAGEPISHSNEPDPGFAAGLHSFSPTLKATAVAKVQPGYGNSSPLHLDIDQNLLKKPGGLEALEALLHTHNHMGGTLINLNCLTKERLMKAHQDPASDPDLVVRVTGYSAFFASLSPEYRQQIVDRFLSA